MRRSRSRRCSARSSARMPGRAAWASSGTTTSGPRSNVHVALASSTMTAIRRQTGFASLDQPQAWPATRGRPRPERLRAELDTLHGVGVTVKRKLAKLGLETIGDLLEHRPRRYEAAADEVAIAALHGSDEVVILREVLNIPNRPLP